MKVLLIIEQCNPEWPSVPLVGYNFFNEINKLVDVTLVTHERNEQAIEKVKGDCSIVYIKESERIKRYYSLINRITSRRKVNWPLKHALTYPIYAAFDNNVYNSFKNKVLEGYFDIVHSITPILPRYPVKIINVCKNTPFILGPVNGGIPFPDGFGSIARKEFAHFNFLKIFSRLIPGYSKTYKQADRILAGSTYTMNNIKDMLSIDNDRISLFFENGILQDFFKTDENRTGSGATLRLLFVGRLAPYKGANLLIDAVNRLDDEVKKDVSLTIVGDGPEKENLIDQVEKFGLTRSVNFTGWVNQKDTYNYYHKSDLFCFPSIREFGGAVVLEAMACGLPCIVINYGGIGEYVTEKTGYKIDPLSIDHIVNELVIKIDTLYHNKNLRKIMKKEAIERAREFQWSEKAKGIVNIYKELTNNSLAH